MDTLHTRSRWSRSLIIVVAIGLLVGILTSFGQTYLPGGSKQFANSYAVWLSASFMSGLLLPSRVWAIVGGVLVQFVALVGYYLASQLRFDSPPGGLGIVVFWVIGGIAGGPLLGLAGVWWRRESGWLLIIAAALPGALYLSEGFYLLFGLGYSVGYPFLLFGLVFTIGLARGRARLLRVLPVALLLGAVFYVGFRYGFGFIYDLLTLGPNAR